MTSTLETHLSGTARKLAAPVAAGVLAFGLATGAFAYDVNSTSAINVDADGIILRDMDATTVVTGTPLPGLAEFSTTLDGATYLFATAAARDAFVADPGRYQPAFGAFCAVGAALGKKLDGDPEIARILDGKLYLFVSQEAVAVWDKDPAGTLAKANANWPAIKDKTPGSL
jgi:YHS domain-containing protein